MSSTAVPTTTCSAPPALPSARTGRTGRTHGRPHRPLLRTLAGPGLGRLAVLLLFLAAVLVPAAPAAAQRVREIFPDPMAGPDLDEIARRIGMSDFQRLAIDPAHVRYLDGYRDLRTRELEPFLSDLLSRGRTFFFNPDPDLVREFLRRIERAERRMATLDEELFAAFDEVLTADQRDMMPQVRKRRELDRLNAGFIGGLGQAVPAVTMDWGRIVDRLDLTVAEREQLEPLVFDFENRVANARRRVRQNGERVLVELVEEAARLFQEVLAGGELNAGVANIWEQLRQTAFEKLKPVLGDLVNLARTNRDVIAQWGPLLSPEMAEQLRTIHYQYGYGEALQPFVRVRTQYDKALRLPTLDPGLRRQVEAMRADLVDRSFRAIERAENEVFDAIRAATFILEDEDAEEIRALEERFEELTELWDDSEQQLLATLGEERAALLDQDEDEGGPVAAGPDPIARLLEPSPSRLLARQPEVGALDVPDAGFDHSGPLLAGPIGERETDWYAALLQLDDGQRALLEAIRLDHADRFAAFREQHADPLKEMMQIDQRRRGRDDDAAGANLPDPAAAAAALTMAWTAADEALAALDDAFFADMELVVLDPADAAEASAFPAVRTARERVRLAAGGGGDFRGFAGRMARSVEDTGGLEHVIDLDLLLSELERGSTGDLAGESLLADYARERTQQLRAYRGAWRTYATTLHEMSVAQAAGTFDNSGWQRMREPRNAVTNARQAVIALNRRTLDRLERNVADAAAALRDRYRRSAYPSVYEDEESAEGPLLAALELPDLGPDQRDRIRDLIAIFRPRYRDLCAELVRERMDASSGASGRREWQERAARRDRIEQHTFDREELNARTLRALRSVLDEQQAMAVGFAASPR